MKKSKTNWKQKFLSEFKLYCFLCLFFFLMFCSFILYRQFLVGDGDVSSLKYGYALIKAAILAKIFSIGRFLKLGRKFLDRSLIFPTLYNSLVFCFFTLFLAIIEHVVTGTLSGKSLQDIYTLLLEKEQTEIFGKLPILFIISLPLFSLLEIGRFMGGDRLFTLFFRRNNQ